MVAGQEVYYLSHSVHFTQRCLYILTWTPPQPASLAGALSPPLTLQQLKADLRLWLQMLAQHVPNAKVLLVGTRDDNSAEYQSVQYQVEAAVDAEIEQLNSRVEPECAKLQKMKTACDDGVAAAKSHWTHIEVGRQFDASGEAKTPAGVDSWGFFDKLLQQAHVVGTPGSGFGAAGEGYFRLSAFNSRANVDEAMGRIKAALAA